MEHCESRECDELRQIQNNKPIGSKKSTVKSQYVPKLVCKMQRNTSHNKYKSYDCPGKTCFPVNQVPRLHSRSISAKNMRREIKTLGLGLGSVCLSILMNTFKKYTNIVDLKIPSIPSIFGRKLKKN